jgi:hypothetical protein
VTERKGWIGCDLDSTLAYCNNSVWAPQPPWPIGEPIPAMVEKIKNLHDMGYEIRIFTARVGDEGMSAQAFATETKNIQDWAEKALGFRPRVTATKDFEMLFMFDDRAREVIANTGKTLREALGLA